jgi:glucose/arabinose dehydrogenase
MRWNLWPFAASRKRSRPRRPENRYRPTLEVLEGRWTPAALPVGFSESVVAGGLVNPTAMEFSPTGLLFVAEQVGPMKVFQNGTQLRANFFRDAPISVDASGERGLLGIAFDPDYASNHYVYVYYTATAPVAHNRVSRFTANAAGDLALAGSERVILELDNLSSATNHNGGAIHFGPDGKLYVAVGDNANGSNSQTQNNLLGKVLRLNADGTIPTDNPFYASATGQNRAIWALGLRNPFTFAFQNGTGRMFINDVGQNTWEEIDDGRAGANYGWPATEGPTTDPNFTGPFYAYDHSQGCAITGGAFYNPAGRQFPSDYAGDYFFADYCGGWIRKIDLTTKAVTDFATGISSPVDLRVDAAGNLYYLAHGSGQVFQVRFTGTTSQAGVYRNGVWVLDSNGSNAAEAADARFAFGAPNDIPVTGDWNGDGVTDVGVYRKGVFILDSNGNHLADAGDARFAFGAADDVPVTGDWNGDGVTDVGVFRKGVWILDSNGSRSYDTTDARFRYGAATDVPVTGDWNGDGVTDVGVYRKGVFILDSDGSRSYQVADARFAFGAADDVPVTGDWNGDGVTDVGVFRGAVWILDSDGSRSYQASDVRFSFGVATDLPASGHW